MAPCDFCSWSKEAFPLPSPSLGHSPWRLLSCQKSTLRPSGREEEETRDNLTERLGNEGCLASSPLCQPSQPTCQTWLSWTWRPVELSDDTSPAGPSNHTREPQGEDLLLSRSPQNHDDAKLSKALGCGTT